MLRCPKDFLQEIDVPPLRPWSQIRTLYALRYCRTQPVSVLWQSEHSSPARGMQAQVTKIYSINYETCVLTSKFLRAGIPATHEFQIPLKRKAEAFSVLYCVDWQCPCCCFRSRKEISADRQHHLSRDTKQWTVDTVESEWSFILNALSFFSATSKNTMNVLILYRK